LDRIANYYTFLILVQPGATPVDSMEIVDLVNKITPTGGGQIDTIDHI